MEKLGKLAKFGFMPQSITKVAGVEPPNVFSDEGDLFVGQPEGCAGISGRPARSIGILHCHQAHSGAAVAVENGAVNLVTASRFNVDVNVGQSLSCVAQKPLEK